MPKKKQSRSLAAQKAWRTRRRNERRRSEIAKRGWITRRSGSPTKSAQRSKTPRGEVTRDHAGVKPRRGASRGKKFAGTPKRQKQPTGKKRGSPPTPPQVKTMYKLTASINYVRKKQYGSYKLTRYFATRKEAEKFLPEAKRLIHKALEVFLNYKQKDWWFKAKHYYSETIQEVAFDQKLIDLGTQIEDEPV